jgi:hypothetical protein
VQAAFLQGVLAARAPGTPPDVLRAAAGALCGSSSSGGAAVGPDWVAHLQQLCGTATGSASMRVVMNCELAALEEDARGEWPLQATLTSGEALSVDVVVAATGVEPSVDWCVWLLRGGDVAGPDVCAQGACGVAARAGRRPGGGRAHAGAGRARWRVRCRRRLLRRRVGAAALASDEAVVAGEGGRWLCWPLHG